MSRISNISTNRSLGEIGFQPGQCPMIDQATATCRWHDGGTINCNLIRECDPYTGNVHFEYALPFPTGNVNIWQVAGPTATWIGSNPAPEIESLVLPEFAANAWTFGNQATSDPSRVHVPITFAPATATPAPSPSTTPTAAASTPPPTSSGTQAPQTSAGTSPPYVPTIYTNWRPASQTATTPAPTGSARGPARQTAVVQESAGGTRIPIIDNAVKAGSQIVEQSGMPWWVWVLGIAGVAYAAAQEGTQR